MTSLLPMSCDDSVATNDLVTPGNTGPDWAGDFDVGDTCVVPPPVPYGDLEEKTRITPGPIDAADIADLLGNTCLNQVATPTPTDTLTTSTAERFGRYVVVRKLGEGGMGAVYLGRDTVTGQQVAIKVLAEGCLTNPEAFQRFEKEARLLEEAHNPYVANMLDLGSEGQTRFMVMEYVAGGDLRRWLSRRQALDEATALDIIGDLCRALATVHSRGMVHRDIKPENVLLGEVEGSARPAVKLTDFGLARHIDQTESLQLTRTGALLGTPYYMAPEQFKGTGDVSAATDVYALGITLFELLAGRRPFQANDPIRLAAAHCFDAPPDVRTLAANVSDGVADLVQRMLAKSAASRPPDAAALLEQILQLRSGQAAQLTLHPTLPDHDASRVLAADFEWSLTASPAELWPYVSNTDRLNRAAGIPAVAYEMVRDDEGRPHKFGQFRMGGMNVRWEEHPCEWIEGRRFSILREFPAGPFVWFLSTVELVERPDGGTLLKHQVRILPRGIAGRLLAGLEVGVKGRRNLDRIYRRINATVETTRGADRPIDHFQQAPSLSRLRRARLQQHLDQLRKHDVREEITSVLHDLITSSGAQDLSRIRPYVIARRYGLPEREVADACLHAVQSGLLSLCWDVICPTCRLAADARQTLRDIEQHANCMACQSDFKVDFGNSIELVFRVHPEIRTIDSKLYCNGGPGNFPHVVAQVNLDAGERFLLPLNLESGSYVLRGPRLPYTIPIESDARLGARHGSAQCAPGVARHPLVNLLAGSQQLTIENTFTERQVVRIERIVRRSDALTAAEATGLPLFRELFPQETLNPGQLVQLATTNFLAIQLDHLDRTFRDLGDSQAYVLLRDFQQVVGRHIHACGGSIVEEQTGLMVITFSDVLVAIESACGLYSALTQARPDQRWSLSGALHRGSALVTSDRNGIRYFGTTVNETLQQVRATTAGQLQISQAAWSDPGALELMEADAGQAPGSIELNRQRAVLAKSSLEHKGLVGHARNNN